MDESQSETGIKKKHESKRRGGRQLRIAGALKQTLLSFKEPKPIENGCCKRSIERAPIDQITVNKDGVE